MEQPRKLVISAEALARGKRLMSNRPERVAPRPNLPLGAGDEIIPMVVVSPNPSEPTSKFDFDLWGGLFITIPILFSVEPDYASLVPRLSVVLDTPLDRNTAIQIAPTYFVNFWPGVTLNGIYVSALRPFNELLSGDPDASFSLRLFPSIHEGGGLHPGVRDPHGVPLDGDYDGKPGGTYEVHFTYVG